jgi:uncharacterized membrane protein
MVSTEHGVEQNSLKRAAWALLMAHVFLSLFGLVGIAIMAPHPEIWSEWGLLADLFPLAVAHGGNFQIILGAAAVLAFGTVLAGSRAMIIFFTVSVTLSLLFEFTGTSFGWPFGNYEYTDALQPQVIGVPVLVPLAWFAMALPAREVAHAVLGKHAQWYLRMALGAFALMAWDVFLDPQMVGEGYWQWPDGGWYRGIPLSNFAGWLGSAAVLMVLFERLLPVRERPIAASILSSS